MGQSLWRNGYLSGNELRRLLLRYAAILTGLGATLQFLVVVPGLGAVPAPFMMPFYPVLVLGILYWVISGRYRESVAVWLTLAVVLLGMIWTSQLVSGAFFLLTVFTMIAIMSLVVHEEDWNLARRWYLIGFIVSAFLLLYSSVWPAHLMLIDLGRLGWLATLDGRPVLDPNQAAMHAGFAILMGLPLVFGLGMQSGRRRDQWLSIVALLLAVAVIVLSESRSGLLAIVGALGIAVVAGRAILQPRTFAALTVIGIGGVAGLVFSGSEIVSRFLNPDVLTGSGRVYIWAEAIDVITRDVASMLFGAGTSESERVLGRFGQQTLIHNSHGHAPQVTAAGDIARFGGHNSFISWLLDYGFVGLLIATIAFMLAVIRTRKVDVSLTFAIGHGMLALFIIMSMSLTVYLMNGVSIAAGGLTLAYLYHHRVAIDGRAMGKSVEGLKQESFQQASSRRRYNTLVGK